MSTYYKYQNPSEIGAAPTLDWGTVISNVNQTLQNQEQQRYENREADKQTTNDILQKLNEVTLTSDPKANAIITRGIYQTKESRMQSYKDLREGKISRSDFNILGQNTKSSIAELQKFSTEYQTRYANFQKALSEGKVTDFSKATQEYMGSFQNMTNKDLIYNPKDGFMYIANLDPETRKVVEGPLGMLPISSLNTEKIYNDTKIDLPTKLASYTDKIQPFIKVIRQGNIETIEGIQQYSQFNDFMTNLVEAIAPDDFAKADLLTQLGIYDVDVTKASTDKTIGSKRAGDNTITPDITKDMKDNLKVALTRFIVANEGYKQTGTEVFAPQRSTGEGKGKEKPEPTFGDVQFINRTAPTGKKYSSGVVQSVGNVTFSGGKGIEHVVQKIGYDDGKLFLQGYTITGKESSDGMFGEPSSNVVKKDTWGNITSYKTDQATGKKTPVKTNKLTSDKNADIMSMYIKQIPNPSTGQLFTSLQEAEQYYSSVFNQGKSGASTVRETPEQRAQRIASGR